MASQSYIIAQESKIITAIAEIDETRRFLKKEGEIAGNDKVYPENQAVWATLRVNASTLKYKLDALLNELSYRMD